MVTCEWMIVCKVVERAQDGETSLIGVFGRLAADELPAVVSPIVAAFRLRGEPNEPFEIQIEVMDTDGSPLQGSGVLSHRIPGYGAWDSHVSLAPLTVRSFGLYKIVVRLNRLAANTMLLQVEQVVH
jgi:hypothetical protein